jgi:hypothetical protein
MCKFAGIAAGFQNRRNYSRYGKQFSLTILPLAITDLFAKTYAARVFWYG